MPGFGFDYGFAHRRRLDAAPAVALPPAPTGFALNGAANINLKAMIARVKAGTGRGRIVVKGDSVSTGTDAGTGTVNQHHLIGAAAVRLSAALASALTTAGVATLDNGAVADNRATQFGVSLSQYDPRITLGGGAWADAGGDQQFAGGNYLYGVAGRTYSFALPSVDTFETVLFNTGDVVTFTIDGAAPSSLVAPGATISGNTVTVPSTSNGFTRIMVKAATAANRTLLLTVVSPAHVRSVMGYNSGARAIDILNHASIGALTSDQAASANNWANLDALGFDAPDLTLIQLGLNDINAAVATSAYTASLLTIINKARVTGDVLLIFPHKAAGSYGTNAESYRTAAMNLAAANTVPFMSLLDYFGGVVPAHIVDGTHGDATFYATVAGVVRDCLAQMNGGGFG